MSDSRNLMSGSVWCDGGTEHWWSSSPIVTAYSGKTKVQPTNLIYTRLVYRIEYLATNEKKQVRLLHCVPFNRGVANRQTRRTVNPFPSGVVGSAPTSPTNLCRYSIMVIMSPCQGLDVGSIPITCSRPTRQIGNLRGRKPMKYSNLPSIENSLKYARSGATHTKIKDPRMIFGISTQPTQSASVMGQSLLSLRQESRRTRDGNAQKSEKPTRQCEAIRFPYDSGMPNAVAGNLPLVLAG